MSTLLSLANLLEEKARKMDNLANLISAEFSAHLVDNLAHATPVDTSKALSNWQIGLGSSVTKELEAHVEGQSGSSRTASLAETLRDAQVRLKGKQKGQSVFISNNASYIAELDQGSSKQAPAGFVKDTIDETVKELPAIVKEVFK